MSGSSPKPAKKLPSVRVRQQSVEEEVVMQGGQSKVSSKIQQLLNTLRVSWLLCYLCKEMDGCVVLSVCVVLSELVEA
jgi:hypothetical protein